MNLLNEITITDTHMKMPRHPILNACTLAATMVIGVFDAYGKTPEPKKDLTLDLGEGVKMEFVLIPAGSFMMGSDKPQEGKEEKEIQNDASPAHKVTISKLFYIGKYEVTQEQWETVMGSNPSSWEDEEEPLDNNPIKWKGPKLPVNHVSWNDAQLFIAKLKAKFSGVLFDLPTEAQWEYAYRAGTTTEYYWGDDESLVHEYSWSGLWPKGGIHPVGQLKPNAWGIYDMAGNVWEWCKDDYARYTKEAATDPNVSATGRRVMRGGAWAHTPDNVTAINRFYSDPKYHGRNGGIRLVIVAESVR